ncbi:MAG: ImmA/IrrE family metallo-endopeptidase [Actinomycetota bacterium]
MHVDPLGRRKIQALVEQALVETDVAGRFPTPLDPLRGYAGIRERLDMSDLPAEFVAKKPPAWKRILGGVVYRAETSFVDLSQTPERVLFTDAHETTHVLLPWHEDTHHLDHKGTLFRETKERLEAEANLGAALIIFQNGRFHEQALDYQRTINTPIRLAPEFGASWHAAIRHYVEYHPDAVALAICGRYASYGALPIWDGVESARFRREFGPLDNLLPALPLGEESPLAELVLEARKNPPSPPSRGVRVRNLRGEMRPFTAEAFFNRYCIFVMFAPRARVRTGRRVKVEVG